MTRTVIPKDCALCDVCNKQCSDSNFIATCDSYCYPGWLYCDDCHVKYPKGTGAPIDMTIKKGDDLNGTSISEPIVMDF